MDDKSHIRRLHEARCAFHYFQGSVTVHIFCGTLGRRNVTLFYLTQALKAQFIDREFNTENDVGISFMDIKSSADFWFYAENLLLDSFYWEDYYAENDFVKETPADDRKILYENLLLGVPRIRQVKIRNDSCDIHEYFKNLCLSCYDMYSEAEEDRAPFGPGKGTAWVYSSDEKTGSISFQGTISSYEGGGYYKNLGKTKAESAAIMKDLKENLWITRGTRVIFIDFSVYNANLNIFCICKYAPDVGVLYFSFHSICRLIFEFPPTGGIVPNHQLQALKLLKFFDEWDYVTFSFECAVYAIAGFFLIEEIRELMYFKLRFFLNFWTYVDLTIILMATANLLTSLIVFPSAEPTIEKIIQEPNEYGNLEFLASATIFYKNFAASLLFFSYIRLFKYLNFNKTMGQLNNTLKNCALDILGFSIMFFIIFFAFAELGYLLFGSQVEDFSTFGIAMFTLLRTILGDFDYQDIERANRVLAPIYFLSYIFFVFFVLLNMFLAIINDTYADVKTEIAIAPDEMSMTEFLKKELYDLLRKCGCNIKYEQKKAEFNSTVQQIRDALKNCGFTDLEIEMFFARYNIDPHAVVADYDVKKIIRELEMQSLVKESLDEDTAPVQVSDFITQQERLSQIELTIEVITAKVDNLIRKFQEFENLRKNRA
ncbi:PKD channel and/or Ion trans domain containing protein [Asbolus verrucosus]|uniref:PKD channel and/or Ion trans domain containing protein n=1 Tax=Asbolus verrucosus TaxID=1661398 RepID=A0A482W5X5_ASBVE|nr:PKD channel and/or Ion trans domain containing protein [Asbolus verrucosus]